MARPRMPIGSHGEPSRPVRNDAGGWRVTAYVRDLDGKRRRVTGDGPTQAAARRRLDENLARRFTGTNTVITSQTKVSVLVTVWLEKYLEPARLADGSKARYREAATLKISPGIGELSIVELTPATIGRFLAGLSNSHKMVRVVLSKLCDFAVLEGALSRNPVKDTPAVDVPDRPERKRPRALDPVEFLHVRDAIRAYESRARTRTPLADVFLLQVSTATRIGEALAIRWRQVDFDAGTVEITEGVKVGADGKLELGHTKTRATVTVKVPQTCLVMLRRRLKAAEKEAGGLSLSRSMVPVIATKKGTFMSPANVRRSWRDAREDWARAQHEAGNLDADLSWVVPHTLRKTMGTAMTTAQGLEAAAALLKHSDTRVTAEFYWDQGQAIPDVTGVLDHLLEKW